MRFEEEFRELSKAIRGGYDNVAKQLRIERGLGLQGLKSRDIPQGWNKHDAEHLVWRSGMFAKIGEKEFESWITAGSRRKDRFCVNTVRKLAQRRIRLDERAKIAAQPLKAEGIEMYVADIREIKKLRSTVFAAAVITDPPYEKDFLELWTELARFSSDVLMEKGWLLAMSGQRNLPEVFKLLSAAASKFGLVYCWTIAVHTPGGQSSSNWLPVDSQGLPMDPHPEGHSSVGFLPGGNHVNSLNCEWKPILVFSKGNPQMWPDGFRDFILSDGNDKRFDVWGQPVNVFEELVQKFAAAGSLVVDPFLGGGTTAVAAYLHGRAFEGFDIVETDVKTSMLRLSEEKDAPR